MIEKLKITCFHSRKSVDANTIPGHRKPSDQRIKRCKNTVKIHPGYKKIRPTDSLFNPKSLCETHIKYNHNHNARSLQAYTYRDLAVNNKKSLKIIHEKNQTPSLASAELY